MGSPGGSRFWRLALLALVISLVVHLVILMWSTFVYIYEYAIPAVVEKRSEPFEIKRVEINPMALKGAARLPSSPQPVAQRADPGRLMAADGQAVRRALESSQPQLTVPAPPEATATARLISVPSSPFSISQNADLAAEVARLEVGPASSLPPALSEVELPEAALGQGTAPGPGGLPGVRGLPAPGGDALPGFDEIVTEFQSPDPGFNARLPEPILLRLPSDVIFEFDSAELQPAALPLLQQAVRMVREYTTARVQVEGHTDTIGREDYNQQLSTARARAVQLWLARQLDTNLYELQARGVGESRPLVAPEGDARTQAPNRRVEITIQALRP
ncbi:MAG: OmpA family protein [Verrucomicrobiota bacterium]